MRNELFLVRQSDGLAKRGEYTISDLARFYDVSLRTLRFYEDKGLLSPRRQGTARYYSANDRIRLELILKGKKLGFTLAEIFELIASRTNHIPIGSEDVGIDLTASLGKQQIAAQITHLEKQRRDLDDAIEELRKAHQRMPDISLKS